MPLNKIQLLQKQITIIEGQAAQCDLEQDRLDGQRAQFAAQLAKLRADLAAAQAG